MQINPFYNTQLLTPKIKMKAIFRGEEGNEKISFGKGLVILHNFSIHTNSDIKLRDWLFILLCVIALLLW